jgi:hypothetical protein
VTAAKRPPTLHEQLVQIDKNLDRIREQNEALVERLVDREQQKRNGIPREAHRRLLMQGSDCYCRVIKRLAKLPKEEIDDGPDAA